MVCPKVNFRGKSICFPKKELAQDPFVYHDAVVLIHDGELMHGIVDKKIVGTSGGSIIHTCYLEKGWEETRRFMTQIQTVVNYWMVNTSYTVSISDTVAEVGTITNIQKELNDADTKMKLVMEQAQLGKLQMVPGKSLMESFESSVNEVLNAVRTSVGGMAQDALNDRNAIKGTVLAGSKGSDSNISQIIACVGQQNVNGKRIQYGFQQRTLPHFAKDDLGMKSRGFVENSYLRGLTPQEFYFHAMGGREGLIDTAVKTSEVGYIQRRLVKAMETVMARYDTTLRNAKGCVIEFLYGEDGIDAVKIEQQEFEGFKLKGKEFHNAYCLDLSADNLGELDIFLTSTNEYAIYMTRDLIEDLRGDIDLREELELEFDTLKEDRAKLREIAAYRGAGEEENEKFYLPVNLDRLIWTAQRKFRCNLFQPTSLHPRTVLRTVQEICSKILVVRGDDPLSIEAQENATLLFRMLLRSKLATKRVIRDLRLNEAALSWIKGCVIEDFNSSMVSPGEMAGVMAAQSVGQPATQMTLNTFHNSGISSKNVTLGVPRLNELLNVSKNIKTPSIFITPKNAYDEQEVKVITCMIEHTTLGDLTRKTEIHFDPDPRNTAVEEDAGWADEFMEMMEVSYTQMTSNGGDYDYDYDNCSREYRDIIQSLFIYLFLSFQTIY